MHLILETISELFKKQKEQQQMKKGQSEEEKNTRNTQEKGIEEMDLLDPLTPESLPAKSPDSVKPTMKMEKLPLNSCGMLDRTRVALLAFMFTFLFVSPLSYVLPRLSVGKK